MRLTLVVPLLLVLLSLSFLGFVCTPAQQSTVTDICSTVKAISATADAICAAVNAGGTSSLETLQAQKERLDSLRSVLSSQVESPIVAHNMTAQAETRTPLTGGDVRALAKRLDSLSAQLSDAIDARTAYP